jgi:glycosyltransferase involved in cell wall biosynthesis
MRKLFYMGLEPYKARYTLQLQDWNEAVFKRRGIDYVIVPGETLSNDQAIVTGQVLDAHGRTYFGMSQLMNLVRMMKAGEVTNEDVVYFEDMFQPGIESLPYIMDQVPDTMRPRIAVRCLAQSIDPDDFVHVWGMQDWMAAYEKMVDKFADIVLASNEEMAMHMKVAGWQAPIYNISGLAFGKDEVQGRVANIKPFNERKKRVVFSARWDQEKQPDFYMDLIEEYHRRNPSTDVEFCICAGGKLKSNNHSYMERTRQLEEVGVLTIHQDLEKNDYYNIVNESRVVFNCALQDWVSNTVSEADALGCNVLYPAYRSFPETFANDHTRLYVPWSIDDAISKLEVLLNEPSSRIGMISDWTDSTIDRIVDILEGKGEQWKRMSTDYRKHTRESKY